MLQPKGQTFAHFSSHGNFEDECCAYKDDRPNCPMNGIVCREGMSIKRVSSEEVSCDYQDSQEIRVWLQDLFDYIWRSCEFLAYLLNYMAEDVALTCLVPSTDNAQKRHLKEQQLRVRQR